MVVMVASANYCPMAHCLLPGLLQLTLQEYMQTLVKHHCHFSAACLAVCYDAHHHSLAL